MPFSLPNEIPVVKHTVEDMPVGSVARMNDCRTDINGQLIYRVHKDLIVSLNRASFWNRAHGTVWGLSVQPIPNNTVLQLTVTA